MCKLQDLEQSAFFDCFLCLSEEEPSMAFRSKGLKTDKLKPLVREVLRFNFKIVFKVLIEFPNWSPHKFVVSNIALGSHIYFVRLHEYQWSFREPKWRQRLPELSKEAIIKNLFLPFIWEEH